jgi:tyrosyl-tRNA synthetase
VEVGGDDLAAGIPVVDLLVRAELAASKGEARRLIKGNGARLNDAAITDEAQTVTAADLNADGVMKLSAGKKRHVLVKAGLVKAG